MTRRAAIYARISRDRKGEELGVNRQRETAEALVEQRGWSLAGTWVENDVTASGRKPRPQWQALLEAVRRGEVDAIIGWNLHRLTRNARDRLDLVETCRQHGVIVALVRGSDLDPNTPSGRLHMGILGEVAQHEIDELGDRVMAQKEQAAASGKWRGGRRPFGYEADGVTVRHTEAAVVADMTSRVIAGESLHSLARELNRGGVRTSTGSEWKPPELRAMLLRARNAGLVEHEREVVGPAQWEAIVDPAQWRNVVRVLTAPARQLPWSRDEVHLGSGVFVCGRCGDGTTMRSASTRTTTRGRSSAPAYRCRTGTHLTRIAAPLDEYVTEHVLDRLSRPDARLLLAPEAQRVDVEALLGERADVEGRLTELAAMFADGVLTGPQLAEATGRLRAEGDRLDTELAAAQGTSPLAGIADAEDVRAAWSAAPVSRRKAVVRALMTVTLLPAPKGRPAGWTPGEGAGYFDPAFVRIEWTPAAP